VDPAAIYDPKSPGVIWRGLNLRDGAVSVQNQIDGGRLIPAPKPLKNAFILASKRGKSLLLPPSANLPNIHRRADVMGKPQIGGEKK
jgi:hypothetical protein